MVGGTPSSARTPPPIDTTVDEGAVVERSRVQESHIGARTNIGPWTLPAPGSEFGEDAKAGAFVERRKKAHIGNGTKVPHLSYVGDARSATTPTSAAPLPPTMTACTRTAPPSAPAATWVPATLFR